ncbi:MAG TPA: efflux RND transporter periplasmic adaptor subunit [Pseudomonadales bacterium]
MTRFTNLALLGLLALALAGCGRTTAADHPQPPPAVEVAEVLAEPATLWGEFTGRVAAPQTVELRPRVSGYIDAVSFTEGDRVEQGDVLFTIDPRPYRARERAAEAALERARSQLTLLERQAERARRLLESRAVSREDYDERVAERDAARATVAAAQAALESARLDLQYTRVRAPISGRVGRALVTRGNLASANETLLTVVVSMDPMYVYFETDQQTFVRSRGLLTRERHPRVHIGLAGEVGHPHVGALDFIDNRLNARTGTIQYRAVVANADGRLVPGQFARVRVPVEHFDRALLVNGEAVLTDQDRRYVYVVGSDGRVERRDVVSGPRLDELVLIQAGLEPGERVVVNGLQKIFSSGVPVRAELVQMRVPEPTSQLAAR